MALVLACNLYLCTDLVILKLNSDRSVAIARWHENSKAHDILFLQLLHSGDLVLVASLASGLNYVAL